MEEGLLYRKLTLFRTDVPSPTPYGLLFPEIGGSLRPPKTSIAIIPGTSKATDFKFGQYTFIGSIRTKAH